MLKIITVREDRQSLRVQLYGEFTAEYLPELDRALPGDITEIPNVTLDLFNVTLVDRAGMKYLCAAQSRRVAIENIPSYVTRWIEQEVRCGPAGSSPSEE